MALHLIYFMVLYDLIKNLQTTVKLTGIQLDLLA